MIRHFLLILTFFYLFSLQPTEQITNEKEKLSIFAHRGAKGTHPENTISAFKEAIRVGADGVEFDVQLTKDNQLVVIHDEKLNRTTNGKGYVKDYTLKELKALDAGSKFNKAFKGERIPTLDEVLSLFQPTSLQINIELKNDVFRYEGMEEKTVAAIKKHNMEDKIILSSFNHESISLLQKMNTGIELGLLYKKYTDSIITELDERRQKNFHSNVTILNEDLVTKAKELDYTVRAYTVNEEEDILNMQRIGVDAIFTDFPEKAMELVKK
ncbi:MAG: glycerophosphodiester phosphodiesterase [Bacillaceae bacterium]